MINLKELRKYRGMTAKHMAIRLGISYRRVMEIERYPERCYISTINRYLSVLNIIMKIELISAESK